MRKLVSGFEDVSFLCAAVVSLTAAGTVFALQSRFHFHNDRVQYGMEHLPAALAAIFLFLCIVGVSRAFLARSRRVSGYPTAAYLAVLLLAYCIFWLPVLLAGGFVQDDWMLLAAASIRKIIYLHPGYSWYTLDSVDGNFRPLGTVLYMAYMLKMFGLTARAFLAGNFLLTLAASLTAFFIVRELGYSRVAATAASLLYMSRGMLYTIVSWVSAISDGIAILFCGLMALAILKANRRHGLEAARYHLLASCCFCMATLGKQSSFAAPLIVALLLLLRPGGGPLVPLSRRVRNASAGLLLYGITAAVPFFHAKALLQTTSPYPLSLSIGAAFRLFSYAIWYLTTCDLPPTSPYVGLLPACAGIVVVCSLFFLAWKFPRLLGDRPLDVIFAGLASVASISLFVVLGTRLEPYYGTMAAFWMSIALGIALTRFGPAIREDLSARIACFVFCVLVASGFADVRLRQTALVPAGGYTWGTYGMDRERSNAEALQLQLDAAPTMETLVLIDVPDLPSYYGSMALLFDPHLMRILSYNTETRSFLANNHEGLRPDDDLEALRNPLDYNWNMPMSQDRGALLALNPKALWLQFRGGNIQALDSSQARSLVLK